MQLFMMQQWYIRSKMKKWLVFSFLFVLVIGTVLQSFTISSNLNFNSNANDTTSQKLSGNLMANEKPSTPLKLDALLEDNPEAFFPNFLFYSIEVANVLIDSLYDNVSGGFYTSTDEHWLESSINFDKLTYDNAQAVLALLKLADAVINQSERDLALDIAEKTGNCLITELYDELFSGFYISKSNNYKKPGIQAKAIQALLALYKTTDNVTYRDIAINTSKFLDNHAWDNDNGYYVYLLSHGGLIPSQNPNAHDPYDPRSKRVDHNVLLGNALLDLYNLESNETYLIYAKRIYDFFNTTCRNTSTGLFYTGLNSNNEIVDLDSADIFINSLVLELLTNIFHATNDSKYFDEFFNLLYSVLYHFWDEDYGGFYATYSYLDPSERDKRKYTERQFYGIKALDEAYKLTNNSLFYNLILDIFEVLNNYLYDHVHLGYLQLVDNDGTQGDISWNDKFTVTQSLAIYSLANLWLYSKPGVLNAVWSPSTPLANEDSVTISAAAYDSDGLSNVLFNYSMNNGPYQIVEMVPHSLVANMFITTLESQNDGTTINFNIIVNDNLGNQATRGSYFFLWQYDVWAPEIQQIGFSPGLEIPIHNDFSITVSAQDVPLQGDVEFVRMYYKAEEELRQSIALEKIDQHLWKVTFPEGLPKAGYYAYSFEAIDGRGNFGYSFVSYFYIIGPPETNEQALFFIIGIFLVMFIFIPAGLYTYVEYKKKNARKKIKRTREIGYLKQSRKSRKRRKRGTKRG